MFNTFMVLFFNPIQLSNYMTNFDWTNSFNCTGNCNGNCNGNCTGNQHYTQYFLRSRNQKIFVYL